MTSSSVDASRVRSVRRGRVALLVALAIALPMVLSTGHASASAAPKKSASLSGPASVCTPGQLQPSISATIESDTFSSIVVFLQTSLENISKKSCSIEIGPTSPSTQIDNPDGTLAWNNCYVGDQPGACPLYLVLKTLKPKATYSWSTTWPPTPSTKVLPTPGTYTFSANFSGTVAPLTTLFVLAN